MKKHEYFVPHLTEEEKRAFVIECEEKFEKQLDEASSYILSKKNCKIVTLSGPTCSGKTTTAERFIAAIEATGAMTAVISIDDFYRSRAILEAEAKDGKPDFDSVSSIDLEYLSFCVEQIKKGESFKLPKFDFKAGERTGFIEFDPNKYGIIIFEGIQAIYPEVTSLFGGAYTSVYISVSNDISVNGQLFTSREVRFMRRIVRDYLFRGAHPEFTFGHWENVAHNEDINIIPYGPGAELVIDSFMEYEPFMIKDTLEAVLKKVAPESRYYKDAEIITDKLKCLFDIKTEYLPENSVYREFLG